MLERSGKNKVTELVLRRMKHTPNLKLHYVFSEPTEVRTHGYRFSHDQNGRLMTTDRNVSIELHMSSAQLGWLTVRPIVSDAEQRRHFKVLSNQDEPSAMLLPIGDGAAPVSNNGLAGRGVRTAKLTGVDLLRREHVAGGHLSLKRVMLKLKLTRSESSSNSFGVSFL